MVTNNGDEAYNNLLDIIINQEKKPKISGNVPEMFRFLMVNIFFKKEIFDNKSFSFFLEKLDTPKEIKSLKSLKDIDMELLRSIINRDSVDNSFVGSIMFSRNYMKNFHPNHPNDFSKVPNEIRVEMRTKAMERNKAIIDGFEKMKMDMEADKKRKIITLIALSIKNIKRRTGRLIKNIEDSNVADIIRERFPNCDEIFTGSKKQMTILSDESLARDLLKQFFIVKSFRDLKDLSDLFMQELERFKKRAEIAFPAEG
jgi:hypothetical protein